MMTKQLFVYRSSSASCTDTIFPTVIFFLLNLYLTFAFEYFDKVWFAINLTIVGCKITKTVKNRSSWLIVCRYRQYRSNWGWLHILIDWLLSGNIYSRDFLKRRLENRHQRFIILNTDSCTKVIMLRPLWLPHSILYIVYRYWLPHSILYIVYRYWLPQRHIFKINAIKILKEFHLLSEYFLT